MSRQDRSDAISARRYNARGVLNLLFAGRMVVALSVYGAALIIGQDWLYRPPGFSDVSVRALSVAVLIATVLVTAWGYWYSQQRPEEPGTRFKQGQASFDVLLVTGAVLLTGGSDSVFPPLLYIALVSGYALITPLGTAALVAGVSAVAYLTAIAAAYPDQLGVGVGLQVAIFAGVAVVSGVIGGRLREMGRHLSNVEIELDRLRVGTADILRTIDAAVITVDEEGRAVYLNPAAARMLEIDAEEWVGQPIVPLLEKRAPGIAEVLNETLELDRPVRGREIELAAEEPGGLPYSVTTALLEREGEPTLATVVLQDLRLARQLEELNIRASRLGVVAELSASLAHEIKNPLASIRSAVEQIADPDSDPEDRETLGRLVIREADRLSRLLGEFNDFARVNIAERKPIDLKKVVAEAVEVVAQRPEAHDRARFEVDIADGLDDLWGDPDLVHRTLTNLLLNAVQVSDPESSVEVRVLADALSPDVEPTGLGAWMPVRIRVIDDGPGIDPDDIGRIFDPFYTRRQGGSGMGLAIAHRAVQAHGGALLVSSTLGHGATFVVILPRREPKRRKAFEQQGGEDLLEGRERLDSRSGRSLSPGDAPALDGMADRLA
jgi:two-component system sensor histidine kinase PilS (NtrC family)